MGEREPRAVIRSILAELYGAETGGQTAELLLAKLDSYLAQHPPRLPEARFSYRDAVLITYGDQLSEPGVPPLRTLAEFCETRLGGVVSGVHLLPFFLYSSDDGFSVIDYRRVDPALGGWEDITRLGRSFRLMFDAVVNHISVQSAWFQGFLQGDPRYQDFFITVEGDPDLSLVVRPRALPLLTTFETASGPRRVWTTFSSDQADLNYKNLQVLLEIIDLLLYYASRSASFIRLDAIAYLWKETGTPCIHLPQTHRIVQLFRAVMQVCAPQVSFITETNVPHAENISYFGDGTNEAQLVYNFTLPPLVLYTLHTGEARALTRWAKGLDLPSEQVTFFNFLASHDGIGLNPLRGILPSSDIDRLVEMTTQHGGLVSSKINPDGTQTPYELNINYFDALSNPAGGEPLQLQVDRFAAAHAIMLAVRGVPAVYFHSLFGSRSWWDGVAQTGRSRTINRQKLSRADMESELAESGSQRSLVFERVRDLLRARRACPAFHPCGGQQVLSCGESIFALLRRSPDRGSAIICLTNVSAQAQRASIDTQAALGLEIRGSLFTDRISGRVFTSGEAEGLILEPYQSLWLENSK